MSNSSGPGMKKRYDLYDRMPPALRQFLQHSAFNWSSKKVFDKLVESQDVKKTLRSMRSKEAARHRRDAMLIWNRDV